MPVGWFVAEYTVTRGQPVRWPLPHNVLQQLNEAGAPWAAAEMLGQRALVKVRAPDAALSAIAGLAGVRRLPKDRLDDPLSDLPKAARDALQQLVLDMGYTRAEVRTRFGNDLGAFTLRDVILFMLGRRRRVRWDRTTDQVVEDGPELPGASLEDIDGRVV